jgi:hypothetical protein
VVGVEAPRDGKMARVYICSARDLTRPSNLGSVGLCGRPCTMRRVQPPSQSPREIQSRMKPPAGAGAGTAHPRPLHGVPLTFTFCPTTLEQSWSRCFRAHSPCAACSTFTLLSHNTRHSWVNKEFTISHHEASAETYEQIRSKSDSLRYPGYQLRRATVTKEALVCLQPPSHFR